jgi:hypothetical protein
MRHKTELMVSEIPKEAAKIKKASRALARAAKALIQLEVDILKAGKNAARWPADVITYKELGSNTINFAVANFAEALGLPPRSKLEIPSRERQKTSSDVDCAFKDYLALVRCDDEPPIVNDSDDTLTEWMVPTYAEISDISN